MSALVCRSRNNRPRPAQRNYRPALEVLEDRRVPAAASFYQQTDLVSDTAGAALIHDPNLVNAWGISLSPTAGAFWVSAHGTGVSTLYVGDVSGSPFVKAFTVTIPGGTPTGQVFNSATDFLIPRDTPSAPSIFIFASDSGRITGWNPAVSFASAQFGVNTPGESQWTGLAIGNNGSGNFLYAADFANGEIDVFDGTFTATTLAGDFVEPGIPDTYSPFNIQNLGGTLYVTYAKRDNNSDGMPDGGAGFVSTFDLNGNFIERLVTGTQLQQPWGLALAPNNFGEFSGALLVGNHATGLISAYDPETGAFLGHLRDANNHKIAIDGLFGLAFGNGVSAGDGNALYFAAGPDGGAHGLFGSLRFVEEATAASRLVNAFIPDAVDDAEPGELFIPPPPATPGDV
jgi:uncharacterized protein (TIGR03118 family)